jgi:signal transduction histidine kinase
MVVALVLSAGGTYLVTNGIVRRIERLSDNAARFARGAPLTPAAGSEDEIGRLGVKILVAGKLFAARREQAVAATRAKDEFLSRVSHELKTPLTAMIGFGELLEEDPDLSPERRAGATRIVEAGHHLLGLIEELLDIKAIEAGKLVIATEPVPVHETVDDAVEAVRSTPAGGTVTITADCAPGLVVAADRRRLREVLVSLLSRAVTTSPDGGRVVLAAEARDATVHIGVTDSGPGISPADRASLFTPFERRDDGAPDVPGGGVGLALAKHVVEAMGGTIGVDSPPGHGSTLWLDLPAAVPAVPAVAAAAAPGGGDAGPPEPALSTGRPGP